MMINETSATDRTKEVYLTFHRVELLHDINAVAYVAGDVLPEETQHSKHQIQDIIQDGNRDIVTRIMNLAFQECVNFLYRYSQIPAADVTTADDTFTALRRYDVKLTVPSDFSKYTIIYIKDLIHAFIVARVLYEWFAMFHPDINRALLWKQKSEDAKDELKSATTKHSKRKRLTQSPF